MAIQLRQPIAAIEQQTLPLAETIAPRKALKDDRASLPRNLCLLTQCPLISLILQPLTTPCPREQGHRHQPGQERRLQPGQPAIRPHHGTIAVQPATGWGGHLDRLPAPPTRQDRQRGPTTTTTSARSIEGTGPETGEASENALAWWPTPPPVDGHNSHRPDAPPNCDRLSPTSCRSGDRPSTERSNRSISTRQPPEGQGCCPWQRFLALILPPKAGWQHRRQPDPHVTLAGVASSW
jgi:hypothetical protein